VDSDSPADDYLTAAAKPAARTHVQLARGSCVDRYILVGELGHGGMGVVYKAYDPELNRPIALKLLLAAEQGSEAARERLLREAQALARLQHPNVIAVYDVGPFRGAVFIAMEFVEGQTLRGWLKQQPRTQREIIDAFVAAGVGLRAAHAAGLVHRDFKPDNVIVGNDGRVRVLDFGLARTAGPNSDASATAAAFVEVDANDSGHVSSSLLETPITRAGSVVGTPRFMAPEQHRGDAADERADQFSFCVSLYHALYHAFPFGGDNLDEVIDNISAGKIADPPPGATVPRWLRQVLVRGLQANPGDRHPSMAALLQALAADPSAARRRQLRSLALVLVVGAGAFAWRAGQRQQARVCAGAEQKLVGVWDEARRSAVRASFRGNSQPYAQAALATVERTFDAYAGAWRAMYVDACEATHVRKEQSAELLDLRMSCLSDRLTELETLSELFSKADGKLVEHAAQTAQSLPALDGCADTAALRAPTPPPPDPETRRRVEKVKKELARADALEKAGRLEEATGLVRAAMDEMQPLNYPPAMAGAHQLLGRLLNDRGDDPGSSAELHASFVAALAGHHEETAARAALLLTQTVGLNEGQRAEGYRWANVAEALISRLQRKDELLSLLYHYRSVLLQDEGKLDEALRDINRSLELAQRALGRDHLQVGETYYELGNVYFDQASYDRALDSYQRCAEIEQRSLGADHPKMAANVYALANVYGATGDHERAVTMLERAVTMLERVRADHPFLVSFRSTLGSNLVALGRPREAVETLQLALEGLRKHGGASIEFADTLANLGSAKRRSKEPGEALTYFQQALAMCERVGGPEHPSCGAMRSDYGELYLDERKPEVAIGYFQRAAAIAEKALGRDHPSVAIALNGVGRAELARHDPAAAKAALERAVAIQEARPGDPSDLAATRFALAQALGSTGETGRAHALAAEARDVYAKATGHREELAEVTSWLARHP
jgi:tetratricopeptide (TPR) repeat protein/predicted Ser/Thr protein kinase